MNSLDSMLRRNKDFAARQSAAGTLMPSLPQALPNVKAIIIGCADMRVDPADILGIKPGEAVVMRNIGGRGARSGSSKERSAVPRGVEVEGEIVDEQDGLRIQPTRLNVLRQGERVSFTEQNWLHGSKHRCG